MSLPQLMKAQEILDKVKENLLSDEKNITVIEQVEYKQIRSGLPSFKKESIILYKNNIDESFGIVKTEGLLYKKIDIEEFNKLISVPVVEENKINRISEILGLKTKQNKPKF